MDDALGEGAEPDDFLGLRPRLERSGHMYRRNCGIVFEADVPESIALVYCGVSVLHRTVLLPAGPQFPLRAQYKLRSSVPFHYADLAWCCKLLRWNGLRCEQREWSLGERVSDS